MSLVSALKDSTLKLDYSVARFADLQEGEQHFVLRTWVGQASRFGKLRLDKIRKHALAALERLGTSVVVLRFPTEAPEADWRVVGFAVLGLGVVHFVYVRPPYRRLGLASLMLGPLPPVVACTAWTKWMPLTGLWRKGDSIFEYVGEQAIPQPRR